MEDRYSYRKTVTYPSNVNRICFSDTVPSFNVSRNCFLDTVTSWNCFSVTTVTVTVGTVFYQRFYFFQMSNAILFEKKWQIYPGTNKNIGIHRPLRI